MVTSSSESPRGVWGAARLSIALAASWAFLPAALPVSADPPDDSSSPRVVRALRVDQPIRIDGHLSEPAWREAEVAGDFFRAQQTRGMPAQLRTEAFVLYDGVAIYVGFRCWEPDMTRLRETLTRRDTRIWTDDAVEVVLDTYHDRRNAYVFGINTLATQMDQRLSNESSFNFAWDASWEAEVRKHPDHWTAEFAIPLAELQYDEEGTTWGVNFWRARPIDQESYSWSDTGGAFGRVSEFGELRGLELIAAATGTASLDLLPYASYRLLQDRPDDGDAGVDLIYQPSRSLIGNLTVFPDFSQLESDPTLINVNDDRELSLPERRPFFRDGAELFDLPLRLFYTRRVQEIDLGVKATGKAGGYTWAALNTYGKVIDRYDGDAKRRANLVNLRLNRDIGERTVIGAMAVHKHQDDRDVGLLSVNGRVGLGRDWTATGQLVGNSSRRQPPLCLSRLDQLAQPVGLQRLCRARGDPRRVPAQRDRSGRRGVPPRPGEPDLRRQLLRGQHTERPPDSRPGVSADGRDGPSSPAVCPGRGIAPCRPLRLLHPGPRRTTAGSGRPLEHPVRRGHRRIHFDVGLRPCPQPGGHSSGRLHLVRQPRRQGQPVRAADDRPGRGPFRLARPA